MVFEPQYAHGIKRRSTKLLQSLYSASMKSYQYRNFDISENIYYSSLTSVSSCFWSTTSWFEEIKQLHEPWNYGARDASVFYVLAVFKNLKLSFSEDNMPGHALDIFIENATKMV